MAVTITLTGDWLTTLGSKRLTYGTGNLGTYTADGIAVTANKVGLGVIEDLQIQPAGGYVFEYVKSTGKIKAYQSDDAVDALDEVGSTDISAAVFRWSAIGY